MSGFWHAVFHVGAVVLQVASVASGVIPVPYNAIVAGAVSAIQAGFAMYHKSQASVAAAK